MIKITNNSDVSRRLVKTHLSQKNYGHSIYVALISVLSCVIATQFYWSNTEIQALFISSGKSVFNQNEYWRLFTAVLIHADIEHLLSNSYMLGALAYLTYAYYGPLMFPLGGIGAAIATNALTIAAYPPDQGLLGASGLVYVLAGFWLTMFLFIERQHSIGKRILRVTAVALVILFPTTFEPQVSYLAHAIGFALGLVMAVFYFILYRSKIRAKEAYIEVFDDPQTTEDEPFL